MSPQRDSVVTGLGAPDQEHRDDEGTLLLWLPGDGVAISRLEGKMSLELACALADGVDAAIAERPGKARAFHDWTAATGYKLRAQLRLTGWSVDVRNEMTQVMVAATAPSVVLAVRAARRATGKDLEVVETREPWEERVRQVLAG